jgi:hypothetical protein
LLHMEFDHLPNQQDYSACLQRISMQKAKE